MTDFDKALIQKADSLSHWDYRKIDTYIDIADTPEARDVLRNIRRSSLDLVEASL
ncbi:MAG: hypothetical protein HDR38_08245 [Treponema sp.]|nr:hypothetical protein [Treponema sp.]